MDIFKAQTELCKTVQAPQTKSFAASLQQYAFTEPSATSLPPRVTRSTVKSEPSASFPGATPPSISPLKRKPPPTTAPSPSPKKKKPRRTSSGYGPPAKYAHLTNNLTDSLAPRLICLFIGVNPGIRTATTGHAYSHPSNLFWKLAHSSGCTPRLCKPDEDQDLPGLYALGHTNIVTRPTRDASELSKAEMDAGVSVLEEKIRKWRPECVCFVGKSVWESVWRVRRGRAITKAEFRYGWQGDGETIGAVSPAAEGGDGWRGAQIFVATTTSGLAAGMRPHEKEEVWKGLGQWVKQRRLDRGIPDEGMRRADGAVASGGGEEGWRGLHD